MLLNFATERLKNTVGPECIVEAHCKFRDEQQILQTKSNFRKSQFRAI